MIDRILAAMSGLALLLIPCGVSASFRPPLVLHYDYSSDDEDVARSPKRSFESFYQDRTDSLITSSEQAFSSSAVSAHFPNDIFKVILSFVEQNAFFSMACCSKACHMVVQEAAACRSIRIPCDRASIPKEIAEVCRQGYFFQDVEVYAKDLDLILIDQSEPLSPFAEKYIEDNHALHRLIFVGRRFYGDDDLFELPFLPFSEDYRDGVLVLLKRLQSRTLKTIILGTQDHPFPIDAVEHWVTLHKISHDLKVRCPHLQVLHLNLLPKSISPDAHLVDLPGLLAPFEASGIQLHLGLTFEPRPGHGFNFASQTSLLQQLHICLQQNQLEGLHLRLRPWDQDLETTFLLLFQALEKQQNLRFFSFMMMKREAETAPLLGSLIQVMLACKRLESLKLSLGWFLNHAQSQEVSDFITGLQKTTINTLEITDEVSQKQLYSLGAPFIALLKEKLFLICPGGNGQNLATLGSTLQQLEAVRLYGLGRSVFFKRSFLHQPDAEVHALASSWDGLCRGYYSKNKDNLQAALFIRTNQQAVAVPTVPLKDRPYPFFKILCALLAKMYDLPCFVLSSPHARVGANDEVVLQELYDARTHQWVRLENPQTLRLSLESESSPSLW